MKNTITNGPKIRLAAPQVRTHKKRPDDEELFDKQSVNAAEDVPASKTANAAPTAAAQDVNLVSEKVELISQLISKVTESRSDEISPVTLDQIERLANHSHDLISLAQLAVQIAQSLPDVSAAAYFTAGQNGGLSVAAHNWERDLYKQEGFRKEVVNQCGTVAQTKIRQSIVLKHMPELITHCIPLNPEQLNADVLAISVTDSPSLSTNEKSTDLTFDAHLSTPLQLLVGSLRTWHARRDLEARKTELQQLAALTETISLTDQASTLSEACQSIANELQKYIKCHRVAVGVVRKSQAGIKLEAISGMTTFDPTSDLSQCFQAAGDETYVRETLAAWPPLNPNGAHSTLALKMIAEHQNVEAVVGVPLTHQSETVAVLILAGSRTALVEQSQLNLLRAAAPLLGSALFQAAKLERNLLSRTWQRLRSSRSSTRITVGILATAVIGTLLLPVSYRMKVQCTVEPLNRRIISAPYDGVLESVLLEPGRSVRQGEILARMDAREIRWELSSVNAERSHASKEFDTELAQEHVAKAQLARMESERLKRKLELLKYREQNHELTAPIDGMILNGGQDKLTGAPVKMGQPLFEIAQLSPLRLEMEVSADDYFHLRSGQHVTVRFDGYDGEEFTGTIERIRQRSEVRNDRNVFVAEMEIDNASQRLRPGIRGQATILGDRHTLAWNTFHKAWEALWKTSPTNLLSQTTMEPTGNPSAPKNMIAEQPTASSRIATGKQESTESDLRRE